MQIREDDLTGAEIARFLADHVREMRSISPPESTHVMEIGALRAPAVTFWSAWEGADLVGCGALKELDPRHGEIKSMRSAPAHRRRGVAAAILRHIIGVALARGYERLSLETGSMAAFAPARALYGRFGFSACPPFAQYRDDPNSVFMTRMILQL